MLSDLKRSLFDLPRGSAFLVILNHHRPTESFAVPPAAPQPRSRTQSRWRRGVLHHLRHGRPELRTDPAASAGDPSQR